MACKVDSIALWTFAAVSAFFLMFSVTNGDVLLAVLLAFIITSLLRMIIHRFIPKKKWLSRKKRMQRIERLLYTWALTDEASLKNSFCCLIPNLSDKLYSENTVILQRLPHGEPISANELLALRQAHQSSSPPPDTLYLFTTCTIAEDAKSILPLLSAPQIEAFDKSDFSKMLLDIFDQLPPEDVQYKKREQRSFSKSRIALFIQNIRPLRVSMYLCFFTAMYLTTDANLYLLSGILYAALLLLHLAYRIFRSF